MIPPRFCQVTLVVILGWSGVVQAQPAKNGDAERGKQLYMSIGCVECHGYSATGSAMTGPGLAGIPIKFETFAKALRSPSWNMPPYTQSALSDASVTDIFSYVASLPRSEKSASEIPLLAR